jgi:hypothetical protein
MMYKNPQSRAAAACAWIVCNFGWTPSFPKALLKPIDLGTCCCGGIACHAGMTAPILVVTEPWAPSGKIELSPVLALAGAVADGIERPPRSAVPL